MNEQTPLLPDNSNQGESQYRPEHLTYRGEIFQLTRNAVPISLSFAFQNAIQAYSIFLVGGIGTFELGVASYGYMFASCTGAMVAIGGATALDTLCAQAFTSKYRSESVPLLGVYLQRGLIILSILFICFIVPVWIFSGKLFIAIGQEPSFAVATGTFLRIFILGGYFQVIAECLKKFLQVQGKSYAVGWAIAFASFVGVAANYVLIRHTSAGSAGAPIAHTVYHFSTLVFLLIYSANTPSVKANWGGLTRKAWHGWTRFWSLAITGILTVATEWWSFEILAIMASRLAPDSIATQGILMASDLILTTLPLGLGVASSYRIGSLLGAGDAKATLFALRTPYILSLAVGTLEFIVLLSVHNIYGYIFTSSLPVIKITANILPLMAGFQVLDLANGGAGGNLRGAGKNHLSGVCNLIGYYGVGLPTAWWLCFRRGLGLYGLWAGIIAGSGCLLILQTVCLWCVDWEKVAEVVSGAEGKDVGDVGGEGPERRALSGSEAIADM